MEYEEDEKYTLATPKAVVASMETVIAPVVAPVVVVAKVNRYSQSRIFAIKSPHLVGKMFIASTTSGLSKKMSAYRKSYIVFKETGKYKGNERSLMKIMEAGDPFIVLMAPFPCNTKEELNKEEDRMIEANSEMAVNRQDKCMKYQKQDLEKSMKCPFCDDFLTYAHMKNHIEWKHKDQDSTSWKISYRIMRWNAKEAQKIKTI